MPLSISGAITKADLKAKNCGDYHIKKHRPSDSVDVTDSYDLDEDNEEQGKSGSVVIEHGKPVIP